MRIARVSLQGELRYGAVEGGQVAMLKSFPLIGPIEFTGERFDLDTVRLVAPVVPSKVIGVGKNFADHAKEMGGEVPAEPLIFLKPSTTVIGPGDPIVIPRGATEVHHEAELAVVIGALCKNVVPQRAHEVIFGYTIANDVTDRQWQKFDGQWWRAKGADSFCPLGPWIDTDIDVSSLDITCTVGDDVRQQGNTADMVRGVPELIAHISSAMTLIPGDVILTGTPAGVGPIVAGDTVHVEIGGLGVLSNPVTAAR